MRVTGILFAIVTILLTSAVWAAEPEEGLFWTLGDVKAGVKKASGGRLDDTLLRAWMKDIKEAETALARHDPTKAPVLDVLNACVAKSPAIDSRSRALCIIREIDDIEGRERQVEGNINGQGLPISGDTLMVGSVEVKLLGIMAPSWGSHCFLKSRENLDFLAGNKPVTCIPRGKEETGRIIGVCFGWRGVNLGHRQLSDGLATTDRRAIAQLDEGERNAYMALELVGQIGPDSRASRCLP